MADGFPFDFSVLVAFRAQPRTRSMLFTVYSSEGDEVLALKVGRKLRLSYQGEQSGEKKRIKFGLNLADGRYRGVISSYIGLAAAW